MLDIEIKCRISRINYIGISLMLSPKRFAFSFLWYFLASIYFFIKAFSNISKPASDSFYFPLILGILVIIIGILFPLLRILRGYNQYPFLKEEMTYIFDENYVSIIYFNEKERKTHWTDIRNIIILNRYILLETSEGAYYINSSSMSSEQKKYILSRIRIKP
jgi:hypothetical protein